MQLQIELTAEQVEAIRESLIERFCQALEYDNHSEADALDSALYALQSQLPKGWSIWFKDPTQKSGGYYK